MSDSVKSIGEKDFESETAKGVSLVDFWADWCGPCRMVGPIIERLANRFREKVKFLKVNIDNEPELTNKHGIRAVPTLMIFKDGKSVETIVGVHSEAEMEKTLKKHI